MTHLLGDRRDHFESDQGQLGDAHPHRRGAQTAGGRSHARTPARERGGGRGRHKTTDPEVKARIERMLTFVDTLSTWYEQVKALPKPTLVAPS